MRWVDSVVVQGFVLAVGFRWVCGEICHQQNCLFLFQRKEINYFDVFCVMFFFFFFCKNKVVVRRNYFELLLYYILTNQITGKNNGKVGTGNEKREKMGVKKKKDKKK